MDRRNALKKIGLGSGAITISPLVVGIFQSCQSNNKLFNPVNFSRDEFYIISKLMELIIPKTEIPGAIDLKLPKFLDGYMTLVMSNNEKNKILNGLKYFIEILKDKSNGKEISEIKFEDIDIQLKKYFFADQKEIKIFNKDLNSKESIAYNFLVELRSFTIDAFKTNEFIGEKILAYDPNPNGRKVCVDLIKTTKGKGWSLF